MAEFAPAGRKAKMTKSQIKKYIKDLEEKRELAKQKLESVKQSGELDKEKKELKEIEDLLEDL